MTTVFLLVAAIVFVAIGIGAFILNNEQKKELQKELQRTQNKATAAEEVIKNYGDAQRENEELLEKSSSGNNIDSANASVDLLHNISQKGKNRNKSK